MTLRVKNWDKFQHYKKRNPPWVKLHVAMLSSEDWVMLDDASKLLACVCLMIASRFDGEIPASATPAYFKRVAYLDKLPNFKPLIESGFLVETLADASNTKDMLAPASTCLTRDRAEQSRDRDTSQGSVDVSHETSGQPSKYAFESGVIRLTKKDFEKWEKAFPNLNLAGELISLTEWAGNQPKWFHAVGAALAKRSRDQKLRLEQSKVVPASVRHGPNDPLAGII